MPTGYKRTYNKRRKHRVRYRKKRYRKRYARVVKQPRLGFPQRKTCKLVYTSSVYLNPGAGTAATHVFRANSVWKPEVTAAGHQPMGFDEMTAIYTHFHVLGSKISAHFVNPFETPASNYIVGVTAHSESGGFTNMSQQQETQRAKYKFMGPSNGGSDSKLVTHKFSTRKFFGGKDVMDEVEFRGSSGADCSEVGYWHVWAGPVDTALTLGQISCNVRITYITVFTEPKSMGLS